MPLPTPAGALPRAHRKVCVRCVRQMKKNSDHICGFDALASKKCSYCIAQKAACVPLPWFCGPEFDALKRAGDASAVVAAATNLDELVTVAAAEAPKTQVELSAALLEETRALRASVDDLMLSTTNVEVAIDDLRVEVARFAAAAEAKYTL